MHILYLRRDSGTVVGSNLTIVDVSSVDFNRKFMCLLATPQTIKGQTSIVVTLKKSSKMGKRFVVIEKISFIYLFLRVILDYFDRAR